MRDQLPDPRADGCGSGAVGGLCLADPVPAQFRQCQRGSAAGVGDRCGGLVRDPACRRGGGGVERRLVRLLLTVPYNRFTIANRDDIENTVLLVVIGAAVTEIAMWGRRQQARASRQSGYLA